MVTTKQPETFIQKAERAALPRWKLETLTGLLGIESLEKQMHMSHANQEAENRMVREKVFGRSTETNPTGPKDLGEAVTGDDMRGHILGDVNNTYPAPVVYPPSQSSPLLPLALLALGSFVPTAGVLGYLMAGAKQTASPPAVARPYDDETVTIGLGRIENYQPAKDTTQP